MQLLTALATRPKTYCGEGVNEENQSFKGELKVQMLEGARAALLGYTATLHNGTIVHTESTLLGCGPNGKLCLWPVMSEIPVVLPHEQVLAEVGTAGELKVIFGSGNRNDSALFREEITIQLNPDGSLVYAHAWGMPGGSFEDRSSCRMHPAMPGDCSD